MNFFYDANWKKIEITPVSAKKICNTLLNIKKEYREFLLKSVAPSTLARWIHRKVDINSKIKALIDGEELSWYAKIELKEWKETN